MIRHICMFKIDKENHDENLKEAFKLAENLKEIKHAVRGEVVGNSNEAPDSNYDLCLIFDFESMDDLNLYQIDPIHKVFVEFITKVKKDRACIDAEF